jgi:hypothetical protein
MSKEKRSDSEIRNGHLSDGAILIEFVPHKDASEMVIKQWRKIEKFGFMITIDGCLIPHSMFNGYSKDRKSGYSYALPFFKNVSTGKPQNLVDEEGYPIDLQYSHLCHFGRCASPICIIVEEKWKNVKRNYCGRSGSCDCGNSIKCRRTYHNDSFDWGFEYLTYDTPKLSSKLEMLFPGVEFKVLPADSYRKQDLKRSNKNKRILLNKKQKESKKQKLDNVIELEEEEEDYLVDDFIDEE